MRHAYQILIAGKVQGVAFRYHMMKKAKEYNITGFVRNLSDGRVEAILNGADQDLQKLLNWCKVGPDLASVKQLDILKIEPTNYIEFCIGKDA